MKDSSILVDMYNAYKKEKQLDYSDCETKYTKKIDEICNKIKEQIPFDVFDEFIFLLNLIRLDEQEKFEQEKQILLKMGVKIGVETNPETTQHIIKQK